MGDQALELGGEGERAVGQAGIMKRLHAKPVAGEEQGLRVGVEKGEREAAVEAGEAAGAPLAPGGEDQVRGAAVPVDSVAQRFKLGAQGLEIMDIAVEAEGEPAVRAEPRLSGTLTLGARAMAVGEADARRGPDVAAIGPAMRDRVDHGTQPRRIDRLGDREMECACNARHR